MASTYYKMQEVMSKLRKSEQDVQDLIKQGKLRQYMDAGKPVFKVDEVDTLAEQIVGLDLTGGSEIDLKLEETGEIKLEPDEEESKAKESEGGFGLSQMGDLTSADTNVGTVGINILSGTDDAYKLTEDTKAETQAGEVDEIESLDADSNLESFGSGSGLLDLSLQADDTSLGAVLDDILPSGAEGGEVSTEPATDEVGLVGETEGLIEPGKSAGAALPSEAVAPVAAMAGAGGVQMVALVPEDPASTLYGAMMFLPVLALVLAGIILAGAIQDVTPSLMKTLTETTIADISLIWYIVGALAVLVLIFWAMTAVGNREKSPKPAKEVYEKKPKKKKK
jgi:hypothetical protein